MINRNDFDVISLLYKLRTLEDIVAEDSPNRRVKRMTDLLEDEQYQEIIWKRFPLCNSAEELLSTLRLPKHDSERLLRLYTRDKVLYHCRNRTDMESEQSIHVLYALSGNVEYETDHETGILKENHVCVFFADVPHAYHVLDSSNVTTSLIVDFYFLQSLLLDRLGGSTFTISFFTNRFFKRNEKTDFMVIDATRAVVMQNFLYLGLAEFINRGLCRDEIISSYVTLFFVELLKTYMILSDKKSYVMLNNTKGSEIISYIDENCESITLSSAAEHFHFHPNYFSKLIRSYTGERFSDLVLSARMRRACFLLKQEKLSITQVANMSGYEGVSYFHKCFKSYYNKTPLDYRKQERKTKKE